MRETAVRLRGNGGGAVVLPCPKGPVSSPPQYGQKRQAKSWMAAPHCWQGKFAIGCMCRVGGRGIKVCGNPGMSGFLVSPSHSGAILPATVRWNREPLVSLFRKKTCIYP